MVVIETSECAANHGIAKAMRAVESSNAAGEALADAEVGRFPRYFFAQTYESGGDACHRSLAGVVQRSRVQIDIAG